MRIAILILSILFINTQAAEQDGIAPIPKTVKYNKNLALLGKKLFSDPLLSKDKKVSCSSCHSFEHGGADPRSVSIGSEGVKGNIQALSVFNARYNFKQFWNGRADSLHEQASRPIHNPSEMNMNENEILSRLTDIEEYRDQFKALFSKNSITFDMVVNAIVEFEMALITPNSPFDQYLRGERNLTKEQADGYRIFKELGCVTCHNGINLGGNSFQKMGLFVPYRYDPTYPDLYSITKKEEHKNVYKVPMLRNIELTAPYFHDASANNLESAIALMGLHDLGVELSQEHISKLTLFLKTLTGEKPEILR